jgi:hypothetical protein
MAWYLHQKVPTFFSNNELLLWLRASGHGCHADRLFLGVTAYAKDICLLLPTAAGMHGLLGICSEFAVSHQVLLYSAKLIYLAVGMPTGHDTLGFELDGMPLIQTHAAKCLNICALRLTHGRC